MSAFADAEVIRLATTEFVPATGDDWYQRRRRDAEGVFFKKITEQSPRRGSSTTTKQGIYVFTADGELLGFNNAGDNPAAVRGLLQTSLKKFRALPEARRKPGGAIVEPLGKPDPQFARWPPVGGAVVQVFTRILDRRDGTLTKGTCDFVGGDKAGRDFLWLTADDMAALMPPTALPPKPGAVSAWTAAVVRRLIRFHLVDNTRGEPEFWADEDIRSARLRLTVTRVTDDVVEWNCGGEIRLATAADPEQAERGFDAKLTGTLRWRRKEARFDAWKLTVLGEHWGAGTFTQNGVRPGRGLLGLTFQLIAEPTPAQTVPPQAARDLDDYFGRD